METKEKKYKVVATITIATDTVRSGKQQQVALNRQKDLKEWLDTHFRDIEAVVCSGVDTLEQPEVNIIEADAPTAQDEIKSLKEEIESLKEELKKHTPK